MPPPPLPPATGKFPLPGKILLSFTAIIFLPVIAWLIASTTGIARSFRIPTGSMMPTFHAGDVILAVRYNPTASHLVRGEIVIFDATGMQFGDIPLGDMWPKRIAAIPGDSISVKDGLLMVNGSTIERHGGRALAPFPAAGSPSLTFPLVIPSGHVFLIGDNFQNSLDSRYFGPVEVERIKFRPIRRVLPTSRAGKIE
jgi:signal peptidase I